MDKNNLEDLQSHRNKKRKEKEPKEQKPKQAELYYTLINAVNRTPLRTLPEPDFRITVAEVSEGQRLILQVDEQAVCRIVPKEAVVALFARYLQTKLAMIPEYIWEHRHILECVKLWLVSTPPITMPKQVRFKSERGLCFHRLPFDPTPDEAGILTPTWDELFSRMSNSRAVKAFIGSLFAEESDRQQYCFLYGAGHDGKGSLARALLRCFGPAGVAQSGLPRLSNKHWAVPYEGKRLVVFPDFDDYESMTSSQLKTLTGDDPVFIEKKYEGGYTAPITCKLLFCSNRMPSISSLKADQRRIIFGELKTSAVHEPGYEKKLWAEMGTFLWKCITIYGELCPRHEPIQLQEEHDASASWGAVYDQDFEYVFDTYFAKLHRNYMDETQWKLSWADPHEVQKRLNYHFGQRRAPQLAFLNWLRERGHQRIRVRVTSNGESKVLWKYTELGLASAEKFDPMSKAEDVP